MNKKIFKTKTLLILFALAFFLFIPNINASNNLLTGKGKWKGYFSGNQKQNTWTEAKGSVYSVSKNKFVADIKSIGHWVEGDPYWHFGVQAQLPSQDLKLKVNNYYRFKSTIKSDKTRSIYVKVVESEMNPTKGQYEDIDNVLLEKWIPLIENKTYNLDEVFYSTSNTKRISIYYAMGWNFNNDIEANSANKIEVSKISISKTTNNKPNYKKVLKNKKETKYSYNNIIGTTKVDLNRNNKIRLYLSKDTNSITKLIVNGKRIKINTDMNKVYIPEKLMTNEYNYIRVYSQTTNQHDDMIISKVIIKNSTITNYKNKKIKQISKYENNKNSKTVKNIINRYKRYINEANSKKEINNVYDEFKDNLKIQKQAESNVKIKNKIRVNYRKIPVSGLIIVFAIVIGIIIYVYRDQFPIINKKIQLIKEKTTKKKH